LHDAHGTITNFLAIKQDMTEQRHMEAQLQEAQKLEAIGRLAAGIAHEIDTPMQFVGENTRFIEQAWTSVQELLSPLACASPIDESVVRNVLQRLSTAGLEYLQKEVPLAIAESLDGIERVVKIVRAMKDFSHPGSAEKQPANINQAIETTVTVARNEWKSVADVQTELAADLRPVPCHINEINQVILNLLVNAAHAIAQVVGDASGGKGKITIRTANQPDAVLISIQDTGCGIPADIQPRIFEPFFTTKAPGKGTGQGLALAYAVIVKKHAGRIWFESHPGQGTTFFVRLPLENEATK
jgi:two-component system, NtrC family, sensor kinase